MKICTTCKKEKTIDNFYYRNKFKNILHSCCKECQSTHDKKYYKFSKTRAIEVKNRAEKQQTSDKNFIRGYLAFMSCIDCKESDIRCLDFDHVRGVKSNNISVMVHRGYSFYTIFKEIEKCEVRCANCHRKRTLFFLM